MRAYVDEFAPRPRAAGQNVAAIRSGVAETPEAATQPHHFARLAMSSIR